MSGNTNVLDKEIAMISPSAIPKVKSKTPELTNPAQMVTLFAGKKDDAKPFILHKDFACHYSPVFKAAFNSQFIEGQTQQYRLEEEKEDVVRLLVEWFYTQVLNVRRPLEKLDEAGSADEDLTLVKLWILADRLLLPRLQNLVIDRIKEIFDVLQHTPLTCLHYVYGNVSAGGRLRHFLMRHCVTFIEQNVVKDNAAMFPHAMLVEMVMWWRVGGDRM